MRFSMRSSLQYNNNKTKYFFNTLEEHLSTNITMQFMPLLQEYLEDVKSKGHQTTEEVKNEAPTREQTHENVIFATKQIKTLLTGV